MPVVLIRERKNFHWPTLSIIFLFQLKPTDLFSLQAWRKRWLVIEFPTCEKEEARSSSILVRVYVSHHHENKGPPAFCIPILDVHALHRIQSRWEIKLVLKNSRKEDEVGI